MKTAIREILQSNIYASTLDYGGAITVHGVDETADQIHQLLCDSMATAMYRCMEHLQGREGLTRARLAEYGFSKEEIELSISKLEKNEK